MAPAEIVSVANRSATSAAATTLVVRIVSYPFARPQSGIAVRPNAEQSPGNCEEVASLVGADWFGCPTDPAHAQQSYTFNKLTDPQTVQPGQWIVKIGDTFEVVDHEIFKARLRDVPPIVCTHCGSDNLYFDHKYVGPGYLADNQLDAIECFACDATWDAKGVPDAEQWLKTIREMDA